MVIFYAFIVLYCLNFTFSTYFSSAKKNNHKPKHIYDTGIIKFMFYAHLKYFSHLMTKATKWHVRSAKIRSAWASAQSEQSFRCPHE